jgi:hypothetical protein
LDDAAAGIDEQQILPGTVAERDHGRLFLVKQAFDFLYRQQAGQADGDEFAFRVYFNCEHRTSRRWFDSVAFRAKQPGPPSIYVEREFECSPIVLIMLAAG